MERYAYSYSMDRAGEPYLINATTAVRFDKGVEDRGVHMDEDRLTALALTE